MTSAQPVEPSKNSKTTCPRPPRWGRSRAAGSLSLPAGLLSKSRIRQNVGMGDDLPGLVSADKELSVIPAWIERGPDALEFTVPLETSGVVIEGLSLRGRARKSLADREVIFQLEYHRPQIVGGPVGRIEWRPLNGHNNKGLGPKEWRYRLQEGSHHHRFDLNWAHSKEGCLRGDIPIAVPLNNDPSNFRALLAVIGKEFTIGKIQQISVPPWEPAMI
jgi:hypothetical protein